MEINDKLAYSELNIDKLNKNIKYIKNNINENCNIIAVIKGDAYGHGMLEIANKLQDESRIKMFAVSNFEEAKICIENNIKKPVLVLGRSIYKTQNMEIFKNKNIIWSIHSFEQIEMLNKVAIELKINVQVHIRIDIYSTGKGMSEKEFLENIEKMFEFSNVNIIGLFAQLNSLYRFEKENILKDIKKFDAIVSVLKPEYRKKLTIHLLNSLGFIEYKEYQYDSVRIGAGIYGFPISKKTEINENLQPIMSIVGRIISINEFGDYGDIDYFGNDHNKIKCKRVGQVALGYWSVPKIFDMKTIKVVINETETETIGVACMDSCFVNLDNIENVTLGDKVYFIGENKGARLSEKIIEGGYSISNCQNLFAGNRLPKIFTNDFEKMFEQVLNSSPGLRKSIMENGRNTLKEYLEKIEVNKSKNERFEKIVLEEVMIELEKNYSFMENKKKNKL